MSKKTSIVGQLVWTHHPRGGFITGYAGKEQPGLYSKERGIAATPEGVKEGRFFTHVPSSQVFLGEPPKKVEDNAQR